MTEPTITPECEVCRISNLSEGEWSSSVRGTFGPDPFYACAEHHAILEAVHVLLTSKQHPVRIPDAFLQGDTE